MLRLRNNVLGKQMNWLKKFPILKKVQVKQERSQKDPKFQFVMVRDSICDWDERKLVVGWYDSELTEKGEKRAKLLVKDLQEGGFVFDHAFCSVLVRAKATMDIFLRNILPDRKIPIEYSWSLNGRHFGALTGMKIDEAVKLHGKDMKNPLFKPPPLEAHMSLHEAISKNKAYAEAKDFLEIPKSESFNDCMERVVPFWNTTITPVIKSGKILLIVAHRDSIRCIVKLMDKLKHEELLKLPVPKSVPISYILDEDFVPVQDGSYKFIAAQENINIGLERSLQDLPF